MNRFRLWLSRHPALWELSIDLLSAWLFTSSWLIAFCGGFEGLSLGMTLWRGLSLGFAGVLLALLFSRRWWILPGAAALGGLVLWQFSRTDGWEELLAFAEDYGSWWRSGFPQGDGAYPIQWVQLLAALAIGSILLLVMRRLFSFLLLLAGSAGAAVWTAFQPAREGGPPPLYPCLALALMGLIVVLPRVYDRYLRSHNVLGNEQCAELSEGTGKAVPISRVSLQLLAVPAALMCVGLAFWMVPEDTSEWQSRSLVHFLWDMGDLFRFSVGQSEGYWEFQLSGAGYQSSLGQLGGPVELSDDTFFEVKAEFPVLLRGSVQDTYTGTGWTDSRNNGRFRLESPMWNGRRRDVFGLSLPRDRGGEELYQRLTREFSCQIYPRSYPYCAMFTSGRMEDAAFLSEGEEVYFNAQGEVFTKNYVSGAYRIAGREFLPRRAGMDQEMLLLERLTAEKPSKKSVREMEEISGQYLQLPEELPQQVRDMAESITRSAVTPYQKAAALCDWLSQNCAYTLSPAPVPNGRDFVDYFLETREGYCVYYASAMTVMARCVGIPARFVSGFGMREGENPNWYYTSEETAHAWTEVYLQDIGWIAFDPLGWDSQPVRLPAAPEPSQPILSDPLEDLEEEEPSGELPELPPEEGEKFPIWPVLFLLLSCGAAAGVRLVYLLPGWFWTEERLKKRFSESSARAESVYEDLLRQLALLGYTPQLGETAFEFAVRVDQRLRAGTMERPMYKAAEVLVRLQFGGIPPEKEQLLAMEEYHQELEHLLKLKMGRLPYFWKRAVPCLWQAVH